MSNVQLGYTQVIDPISFKSIPSGKIYIGEYGTLPNPANAGTWKQAYFVNSDGTRTAASQPIATNSAGYAVDGSGNIKSVQVDGQYSILVQSSLGATKFSIAKPSNTISVSDVDLGDGRTQADKNAESVSVKDFGAKGDGITDDTSSINAAISSLPSGGSVYFPRGVYVVSSTITLPQFSRIRLHGDGNGSVNNGYSATTIKKASSLSGECIVVRTDGSSVDGMTIQGVAGNGGDGILIKASRVTLRDVSVFAMGRDGIRIGTDSGGENCNLWNLDNVRCKANGRHGVHLSEGAGALADCNAGTLLHPDLQSNGECGLYINGAQLNTFVGGAYQNNGTYGVQFTQFAKYNTMFGGDIEANVSADVRIESGSTGNAIYSYTLLYSQFSISATNDNNRIECVDHNRVVSGIKFPPTQVASSDANTLDDYEEVTFTPVVAGATTAGTGTYSEQRGTATKTGDRVEFVINVSWTAHTGTGSTEITGLPFTASTGGVNPRYVPLEIIQNGGPAPGAGKTRIAFFDTVLNKIQLREFDPATAAISNSNAITATGTLYIRGNYRSA